MSTIQVPLVETNLVSKTIQIDSNDLLEGPVGPPGPSFGGIKDLKNDYGAVGNGVADDTAALQAALDDGSPLFIPVGLYKITAPVVQTKVMKIWGAGHDTTVKGVFSTTQNHIWKVDLAPSGLRTGGIMEGFVIEGYAPALVFDLTSGSANFIDNWIIRRMYFVNRNTSGLQHAVGLINPTNQDGFFSTKFERNIVAGGFKMQRLGDSVHFHENIITNVPGSTGVGIEFDQVQGATHCTIERNNITNRGRAIQVGDYARCVKIIDNNIEAGNAATDYIIYLKGSAGKVVTDPIIRGNTLNGHSWTSIGAIGVDYCSGGLSNENNFTNCTVGHACGSGAAAPIAFRIGRRNRYSGVTTQVSAPSGGTIVENGSN